MFAANWLHNIAHAVIGVAGLAVYRSPAGARTYALVLGVAYAALFVLGLISGVTTFGGLLPLNEWDHGLHLVTSLLASVLSSPRGGHQKPPALKATTVRLAVRR
jgi:hypothetical protein